MSESKFFDSLGGIILISAVVTIGAPALLILILCLVFVCIVKLARQSKNCASSQIDAEGQPKQTELEGAEFEAKDPTLSEVPPPSYEHIDEYKNVDLENDGVVRTQFKFSLLTNNGTSSPPDYDSLEVMNCTNQ